MRPLSALSRDEASRLEGIVTDLDDTVLDHGALTREAFEALFIARDAGLAVLGATGRPAGWGEVLARQWPVIGVLTENGAVIASRDGARVLRTEWIDEAERSRRTERVEQVLAHLRQRFSWLKLSDDCWMRRADRTIDVGETVKLERSQIDALSTEAQRLGARVSVSSVHLHVTLDEDDKATGALRFLHRTRGVDPTRARATFAFCGDSGNDAAGFSAFSTTFGVANVRPHLGRLSMPPRYVASRERGAGFREIVDAIVARRR